MTTVKSGVKDNSLIDPSPIFRCLCKPFSPVTVSYITKQREQIFERITPNSEKFLELMPSLCKRLKGRTVSSVSHKLSLNEGLLIARRVK